MLTRHHEGILQSEQGARGKGRTTAHHRTIQSGGCCPKPTGYLSSVTVSVRIMFTCLATHLESKVFEDMCNTRLLLKSTTSLDEKSDRGCWLVGVERGDFVAGAVDDSGKGAR